MKSHVKICFRLRERRVSSPKRDLALGAGNLPSKHTKKGWKKKCIHYFKAYIIYLYNYLARSSPFRKARKFPCKREVISSSLTRARPSKRARSLTFKHPFSITCVVIANFKASDSENQQVR